MRRVGWAGVGAQHRARVKGDRAVSAARGRDAHAQADDRGNVSWVAVGEGDDQRGLFTRSQGRAGGTGQSGGIEGQVGAVAPEIGEDEALLVGSREAEADVVNDRATVGPPRHYGRNGEGRLSQVLDLSLSPQRDRPRTRMV